jgi:hypothetical protein
VWRLFNRRFGSFYSPDVPKGAMVHHAKAATWEHEAEADADAERLNERDRVPEYGATTTGSRCSPGTNRATAPTSGRPSGGQPGGVTPMTHIDS